MSDRRKTGEGGMKGWETRRRNVEKKRARERRFDEMLKSAEDEVERLRKVLTDIAEVFPENHTAAVMARRALEGK